MKTAGRFTLLELLIVIAIIMLLMGILLPMLKKSKEKANEVICIGNLRQIGLSISMYAFDNNNWMPASYISTGLSPWTSRLYTTYIKDPRIFICPSGTTETWSVGTAIVSNYKNSSYLGFCDVTWGYPTYLQYGLRKMDRCRFPSVCSVSIDAIKKTWGASYDFSQRSTALLYVDMRHSSGINTLFVDGHTSLVKILQKSDLEINQIYKWNGLTYWQY